MTTITIIKGVRDLRNNNIIGVNQDTWADLTNWSTWTNWNSDPDDVQVRADDDLGSVDVRVPTLELLARGTKTIVLKVSNTGTFSGEETTYTLTDSLSAITSGRYYRWIITVTGANALIQDIGANYTQDFVQAQIKSLNTSALSGTITAREIPHTLGTIYNAQITAHESTPWVDRFYVAEDSYSNPTNIAPIVGIISQNPLTICLRDEFGVPCDGTIDVSLQGSPKVYLTTNGVVTV